jgi:nicotinate-nucleotide pyrophosphorylase (carboxylating)
MILSQPLDRLLWMALEEDLGHGDITTEAVISSDAFGRAIVVGREDFVLSGSYPFQRVFQLLEPGTIVASRFVDGERIPADAPVFEIQGRLPVILSGERVALNMLQRLSGIATLTRSMADALAGTSCRLLDTRKTTPLWRRLEKQAVIHGGGHNHRFGLADGILIKDNHIASAGGVREAIERARNATPHTLRIEIEVDNLEQLREVLEIGVDVVLLDNFTPELLVEAVAVCRKRALLEASGGVTLENIRLIAGTGVDFISSGALTHSARAVDISLEVYPQA